jgi:hypothetical protein
MIDNFMKTMKKYNYTPDLPGDIDKPILDKNDLDRELSLLEKEYDVGGDSLEVEEEK